MVLALTDLQGIRYRYFKGGEFVVLKDFDHLETNNIFLQCMDMRNGEERIISLEEFFGDVVCDGVKKKRFTPIEDEEELVEM